MSEEDDELEEDFDDDFDEGWEEDSDEDDSEWYPETTVRSILTSTTVPFVPYA